MSDDDVTVLRQPAQQSLAELAERLRQPLARAACERAVVFGSYARGHADGFSDVDLAVVVATDLPRHARGVLVSEIVDASPLAMDVLVFTPAEFRRGLERGFGVFDAIAREGVTIYERSAC